MERWWRRKTSRLQFTPRSAVSWFAPDLLWTAGVRVLLTTAFSTFLDKRELQGSFAPTVVTSLADEDEAWVDYLSDTGDGFGPTFTMACLLTEETLAVKGLDDALPRGRLLVLGGDEVYPLPGPNMYEDRLEGPFEAAWPRRLSEVPLEPETGPELVAIPGNHDWYDGLTNFLRVFRKGRHIGGWKSVQTRSYFAVQLPHDWWIWGLDIQLDSYIDAPQFDFFHGLADRMGPTDQLIIVTAVPSWVDVERRPDATRNLEYLERKIIRPKGVNLRATIAGDSHHYARYTQPDIERFTAGGGGAFLHPTHSLPRHITMTAEQRRVAKTTDEQAQPDVLELQTGSCYPNRGSSRRLALLALLLPARNVRFIVLPGFVCVVLLWSNHFGNRLLSGSASPADVRVQDMSWSDYVAATFRTPTSLTTVTLLLALLVMLAQSPPWAGRGLPKLAMKIAMGMTHFTCQYVTAMVITLVAIAWVDQFAEGAWFTFWVSIVVLAAGGVAGSLVLGAYFTFWNAVPGLRTHSNAAFAASRLSGHKNFLRLHVEPDGDLVVHAIGVRHTCHKWRETPEGPRQVTPAKDLPKPHLIEAVRLEARPPPPR